MSLEKNIFPFVRPSILIIALRLFSCMVKKIHGAPINHNSPALIFYSEILYTRINPFLLLFLYHDPTLQGHVLVLSKIPLTVPHSDDRFMSISWAMSILTQNKCFAAQLG